MQVEQIDAARAPRRAIGCGTVGLAFLLLGTLVGLGYGYTASVNSPRMRLAAAQASAYPCIGPVLGHKSPGTRRWDLSNQAVTSRGVTNGPELVLPDLLTRAAMTITVSDVFANRAAASGWPQTWNISGRSSYDQIARMTYGKRYCALGEAQRQAITSLVDAEASTSSREVARERARLDERFRPGAFIPTT